MAENSVSEEDILDNIKLHILQEKREYLCKYLVPDRYYAYLRSKFVITEDDQHVIEHEITRTQKVSKFLDILQCKGGEAYEALVKAIRKNKTQTFIVENLHKEFEKRKNKYHELVHNTRPKELMIPNSSLPKPAPPPVEHDEMIEREIGTVVFTNKTGKEHKNIHSKNREPIQSGYEASTDLSNSSQNLKDSNKKHSQLIPVTVTDSTLRTLQVEVANEFITVTGPPCNPHMGPVVDQGTNRSSGHDQIPADKSQKEHANHMRNKLHARAGSLDTGVKAKVEKVIDKTSSLNLDRDMSLDDAEPETNGAYSQQDNTPERLGDTTPARAKRKTENLQTNVSGNEREAQRPISLPTTIQDVIDDDDVG